MPAVIIRCHSPSTTRQPRATERPIDTPLEVIAKLIPAEVITVFTAASAFVGGDAPQTTAVLVAAGALSTPLVLALHGRRTGLRPGLAQHIVQVLTFLAWAFTVANPLTGEPIDRWIPGLAIVIIPILGSLLFPLTIAPDHARPATTGNPLAGVGSSVWRRWMIESTSAPLAPARTQKTRTGTDRITPRRRLPAQPATLHE